MGREDIDVRCLGRGRPFVIEFKNPKRREIDLSEVEKIVNSASKDRVEINSLRLSNRSEVVRVKGKGHPCGKILYHLFQDFTTLRRTLC
jgi:tRNA pseudouridine synthase 10